MPVRGRQAVQASDLPLRPAPTAEEIREQLERILSSSEFQVPQRGCSFLRYVVEETLAGRADRIKGFSIAIEVFERDEKFTQDDPVVRIEAGRIRRALERYYLVAGQKDPILIEIPKGAYVPLFSWNTTEPLPPLSDGPVQGAESPQAFGLWSLARGRTRWVGPAALTVLAGILVVTYVAIGRPAHAPSAPAATLAELEGPTLVVAPFADLGEGPRSRTYAVGLTEELLSVLPRFKEITVLGRETSHALSPKVDADQVKRLGARYLLSGGVQISGERIRVTSRLMETGKGVILWSHTYDDELGSRDLFAIQSDVASQVATVVAQPYGIIYKADTAAAPPPNDLDAYGCTLQFYGYRAELNAENHIASRGCLERAVARFPGYATAWSMLSIIYLDEDRFGFNPREGSPTSLELALIAARRAVDLDPRSIRALQALMTALFFNNRLAESMDVGERALALNPNDTEFLGEFGTRLASSGQWQRGEEMLKQALLRNPGASGYYHAMLALTAHMLQDDRVALSEIQQADLNTLPLFHLIAAVIFAQNGMMEDAFREGRTFNKLRPNFMPNIDAELRKRHFPEADIARMVEGSRKAGMLPLADEAAIARP